MSKPFFVSLCASAVMAALNSPLAYAEEVTDEVIEVKGKQSAHQLGSLANQLSQQGVKFSAAGGVSALPVLNGFMGDRIKVVVDGAEVTAACANQMNPPLSYVSANQVTISEVIAGVNPVRTAGDNIAGVIRVEQMRAEFAQQQNILWQTGYLAADYQSNGDKWLTGAGAHWASESWSIDYQGAFETANSTDDGNGDKILDTLYQAQNHALTVAWRDTIQQLVGKVTVQAIPYQGFPNQYMDMTDNQSVSGNLKYTRQLQNDGQFTGYLNWQSVEHEMGFFTAEKPGMMPMLTESTDLSYKLHWQLPLNESTLYLGHEAFQFQLDDYWPAVADSMMMGPNPYININDGKRRRLALFADSDTQLGKDWLLTAGARVEHVTTDAGEVQPYNSMPMMGMPNPNVAAAEQFNQAQRRQTDTLIDATVGITYSLTDQQRLQLAVARKNRAPNLYERYSWGRSTMAATMIGWFGDGNGYVGNIELQPETAHTLSASYRFDDAEQDWSASIAPYYTKVNDYIDGKVIGSFNRSDQPQGQRNLLQMSNIDATLYGIDAQLSRRWLNTFFADQWQMDATVSYTRGERDNGEDLFQLQPLTTSISIQQQLGQWQQSLRWQFVASKDRVDPRRLENETSSYHLLSWQSKYQWQQWQLSVGVTNLLDEFYRQPLGGVSIADYKQDPEAGFNNIAGEGRSVNLGVRYRF